MRVEFQTFATGAIIGRASAPHSRRRAMSQKRDPLTGLGPSQRRIALVCGQIVGNTTAAVFLGYELYVSAF